MGSLPVINQRYRIEGVLGEGGQGVVYRVADLLEKGGLKALKSLSGDEGAMLRFEFERARRVSHPHLVKVYDLGKVAEISGGDSPLAEACGQLTNGSLFFTQEWVDGAASHKWAKGRSDRGAAACDIGIAAASALAAVHGGGLLHRDVKPGNILVGSEGREIKLIDFGLASQVGGGFRRSGTLGYAAEEALHGYADERSDIYSLGIALMRIITGREPRAFFPAYPEGIRSLLEGRCTESLASVIDRMCDRLPERRFQSAKDAAEALAKAAGKARIEWSGAADLSDLSPKRPTPVRAPRLVGRSELLADLTAWLDVTSHASGTVGILVGPPGVGKSRLFEAALTDRQLLDTADGRTPPELISGTLRTVLGALSVSAESGPEESHAEDASEDAWIDNATAALRSVSRPTVVHFSSDVSLLLPKVLRRIARMPDTDLLRVVVERHTADSVDAPFVPGAVVWSVPPLSEAEDAELAAQLIGKRPNSEFASRLHLASGGIPLVTEALVALLLERAPAEIETADFESLRLRADPVDAAVASFLDVMAPFERELTELLAVISRPVSASDLTRLIGDDGENESAVVEHYAFLARNGWGDLTGDAALLKTVFAERIRNRLPLEHARKLHRSALVQLERTGEGTPWEIADHAAAGELSSLARDAAVDAYTQLRAAGDLGGAANYLAQALSFGAYKGIEKTEMLLSLTRLYRQTGAYELALETAARVEKVREPWSYRGALERALTLRLLGDVSSAAEILDRLATSSDAGVRAEAVAGAARIALDQGNVKEAKRCIDALQPEDLRAAAKPAVSAAVGLAALSVGETERAMLLFSEGLEAAEAADDWKSAARCNALLGMVHHRDGDFPLAAAQYETALQQSERARDRHGAAAYASNLGAAYTELGRIADALDAYRKGAEGLRIYGRPAERIQAGANFAELLNRIGDLGEAEVVSGEVLRDAKESQGSVPLSLLCVRGEILMSLGRIHEAGEILGEAETEAVKRGAGTELASARIHLSSLALQKGSPEESLRILESVDEIVRTESAGIRIEWLRAALRVAEASGEGGEAAVRLWEALPSVEEDITLVHLDAFAQVAISAHRSGIRDLAVPSARIVNRLAAAAHEASPPAYREALPPYFKEMNMILRAEEGAFGSDRTAEWEHLARINTRLNSEFRVRRLLEMIMDAALDITSAERGFLLIARPSGELVIRCARNMDKESLSLEQNAFSRGAALRAFESGEPLLTTDAREDSRFDSMKSVANFNLRYIAAIPLSVEGKPQGTIYLDSKRAGRFDDSRISLLEALADQAAIALTNARLRSENRRRQQRIERLNRELASELKRREGELTEVKGKLESQTLTLIGQYRYKEIVARSKPMAQVFRLMDKVAPSDFPVLLGGESGTGKELVARAIHFNSARKKRPFVAENCAAIPEMLMESVLFGHIKGAFTGATADNRGLFVEADGGTLFLDEVSELSLAMQAKLLRVLQNNEIRPVGGAKTRTVDVRIIAASNADLKERVRTGAFREDLFYRLNVIDIQMPPLRERREDVLLLAEHFVQKHSKPPKTVTPAAAGILLDYAWPGNVRQLENEIIRATVLADDEIRPEHLSSDLISGMDDISFVGGDLNLNVQVDQLKKRLLFAALSRANGNQTAAASLLGISRFGLQKMLKRLEIDPHLVSIENEHAR